MITFMNKSNDTYTNKKKKRKKGKKGSNTKCDTQKNKEKI